MPVTFNRFKSCAVRFEAQPGPGCLLTVDSGAKRVGAAFWYWHTEASGAALMAAGTLKAKEDALLPAELRQWTFDWMQAASAGQAWPLYSAVEVPKKRPNKRKYHKDLNRLLTFVEASGPWTLRLFPEEWKAGVGSTLKPRGKEPHHHRLRKALDPAEQALFDAAGPDGKDAVGIGLYVLGRTQRGGRQC